MRMDYRDLPDEAIRIRNAPNGVFRPMDLPEVARLFRKAFDFNKPVSPFSFEFQIPESLCQS